MLEEIFQITHNCNVAYADAWDMPVAVRKWWIKRTFKEQEKSKGNPEQPTSSGPPPWARKPGSP